VLCDHCLLRGYASGIKAVDADTVAGCAKALGLQPLTQSPRNYVFPFQMRKIENEEIRRPGRGRKKLLRVIFAIAIGLACILTGYLAFQWGVHEYIFNVFSRIK
jgi:hypothetical protein